jgi:multidrug efflux pump subunit AcrA (membrane-fusion protein)
MKLHASLLAIGLALLAAGCNQTHEAAKPAEPRPVLVADAHFAPREEAQVLAGVIKARVESDLSFRVGGKIAARLVDARAFVREGDALAKLDETDFRLQLEEADAELNSAKAALVQADAEERRLTTLSRQGWAANADFDRVHAAADQARRRRARRPRGRSGAQRDGLYHSARRRPRRDQRCHGRARPGRRRQRADRPARSHGRARGRSLHSRNTA